jgi:hypothetical protein
MRKKQRLANGHLLLKKLWEQGRHSERYDRIYKKFLKTFQFDRIRLQKSYGVPWPFPPSMTWSDIEKQDMFKHSRPSLKIIELAGLNWKIKSGPSAVNKIDHPPECFPKFGGGGYENLPVNPTDRMALSIDLSYGKEEILAEASQLIQDWQKIRKSTGKAIRRQAGSKINGNKKLLYWLIGTLNQTGLNFSEIAKLKWPRSPNTVIDYIARFNSMSFEERNKISEQLRKSINVKSMSDEGMELGHATYVRGYKQTRPKKLSDKLSYKKASTSHQDEDDFSD